MISVCPQCGWSENNEYQPDTCPSCDSQMTCCEVDETAEVDSASR